MNITSLNISNTDAFENAYILSHNGLGDNIVMNGAINFLLNYYNNVYFLVKDIYYDQINYLYCDNSNVIVINFDSKNENASCYNILCDKYKNNDIFISGSHKSYLKSQITNDKLKMYIRNNKFDIAEKYVFLPTVFCYTEIIKNSIEIYASDSCISCIIIPLFLKKQLKCNYINIFNRETNEKVHFSDFVI